MNKKTIVLSVFPACGKTYMVENCKDLKILDSDSSNFSWYYPNGELSTRVRNPEFPNNYIQHIKENMNSTSYLFVSSNKVVREALKENKIPYVLVYPERDRLNEWVGRCYIRGRRNC